MTTTIIVSEGSVASDDPADVVLSNSSFVALVLEEDGDEDDLHPDSLRAFAVDRFLGEVLNGGFSQYVYNTRWNAALNDRVAEGLERMGAHEHLAWFAALRAKVDSPEVTAGLEEFFAGPYFGENAFRDSLDDDAFWAVEASLPELLASWLRAHPDLQPLSIDDMFARAEELVGHPVDRG